MQNNSTNKKRIAKNTFFLYFRTLFVILITLYTSRVILQTLGVEDFGIYNVVGGITIVFGFIRGTLADSSQRYITFEIGKGQNGDVSRIFSNCVMLHIGLAIILAIFIELIGVWFIENKLMISEERLDAALWVFHFMIVQMIVMVVSVPYSALIIAYERMRAFAFISIIEALIKLGISFAILLDTGIDKLITYGFLLFLMQIVIRFIYIFYCKKKIKGINFYFVLDKKVIQEIGRFSSWAFIGNMSYVGFTQGLNILIGTFFLPTVNAARGIAVQVQTAVHTFVKNFQTALNPQITKNYASGNLGEMLNLVFLSSRFSFFLIMIPIIPILFEVNSILHIWLKIVPEYTESFLKIILLISWINCLGNPLAISSKATGNIKKYECYSASIKLLIVPISYFVLRLGYSPVSVFFVHLVMEILALSSNIIITKKLLGFSLWDYYHNVISRIVPVALSSFILPLFIVGLVPPSILRTCVLVVVSLIWSCLCIYYFGLAKEEKHLVKCRISKFC